jgi:hypothetical protein
MARYQSSRRKQSPQSSPKANSDALRSRPFAPAPESPESIPGGPTQDSQPAEFAVVEPGGVRSQPVQAKLTIGAPNDPYEQEADRVAAQVVQHIHSPATNPANPNPSVQRDSLPEEEELQMKPLLQRDSLPEEEELQMKPLLQRDSLPEEEELQMKPLLQRDSLPEEEELQMKPLLQRDSLLEEEELQMRPAQVDAISGEDASTELESAINNARGRGQPLPPRLNHQIGQAMGADFSGVRVHTDTQSDQLNRSIQAKAFTTGQDVFFRQGAYQPDSRSGQELIAHELTHVVQQNRSSVQRHQSDDEQLHRQIDSLTLPAHVEAPSCCCSTCQSNRDGSIQRQTMGDAANQWQRLHLPLKTQIQRQGVQPNEQLSSTTHNQGCVCAQCTGSHLQLQRKSDVSHGTNCSCPQCTGQKQVIQPQYLDGVQSGIDISLQRHRDDNDWAQRSPEKTSQAPLLAHQITTQASSKRGINLVQRHTAYEHYLLGQVEPSKLASLPMVREIPALEKEFTKISNEIRKAQSTDQFSEAKELFQKLEDAKGKKEEVRHTLEQEMNRLWEFKNNPEVMVNQESEIGKIEKDEDDKWQVPIVKIPVKGDGRDAVAGDTSIIVSYSEINTFPDFFGNPETIANTRKSKVLSLLQGVRQQSYIELSNMYKEIFGEDRNQLADWSNRENLGITQGDFQGAVGPRGQAVNDWAYEKRTEMQVQSTTKRSKSTEKSQEYFAALERNACHFAPYSWDQWEAYHRKARDLAAQCAEGKEEVEDIRSLNGSEDVISRLEQEALELGNQALLQNAFGEHYLQDSFAAGHLIDKTGVMQEFTNWINANGKELGSTEKFKAQWAMASMVAKKRGTDNDLEKNPQMLDDQMMRGELDSVGQAADSIGLGATEDIVFMMWWRNAANANPANKHLNAHEAARKCPLPNVHDDVDKAEALMEKLVDQNFAKRKTSGIIKKVSFYSINQVHVDVLKGKGAYQADLAMKLHEDGEHDFQKEAEEFNLAAYNAFLSNAYIQGATKYFHDKYCQEGLEVITGTNEAIGRIYGDTKMLSSGAQKGVLYAAETSQMSREAIFNIMNGSPDLADSVDDIRTRFPTKVIVPDVGPRTLENWNYQFLYTNESFKEAAAIANKIAYKAMKEGGISGGNAINVGEIVKHDGDVF